MDAMDVLALAPALDARLTQILQDARIPGAAIAVVHQGQSYIKLHGVRRASSNEPVTAQTAFDVGSCSKSYVAAAILRLVEQQRLAFDDAVGRHLPELQLDRPEYTAQLTVRDLLSNR